jgi:2-C-methyl-D-erythritol 2,4-cyclodiphosphate synthase
MMSHYRRQGTGDRGQGTGDRGQQEARIVGDWDGRYNSPQVFANFRRRISLFMRVGIGHDTHRLAAGGPLRLGGIDISHDRHAVGHSDADVLLHAITDALLGAAALGDIGELFPDTDEANRGRDSADMLKRAAERVETAGYAIANLDCIVFAQRPKLSGHKDAIRRRIAEILGLAADAVGVKAKTGEGVGEIGREETIMAQCVALLRSANEQ